jgi:V-type H+-transporting ATPase subunit D
MGSTLRDAAFSLTEARYAAGDFRHTVFDNVESAGVKVEVHTDNVAGVKIPRYDYVNEASWCLRTRGAGGRPSLTGSGYLG